MSMVYSYTPRETETGPAGEHPVKGYRGQAHQTMRSVLRTGGRDVQLASRPYPSTHRMIDLSCLNKTHLRTAGCPRKPVSRKPGAPHKTFLTAINNQAYNGREMIRGARTLMARRRNVSGDRGGFSAFLCTGVVRLIAVRN